MNRRKLSRDLTIGSPSSRGLRTRALPPPPTPLGKVFRPDTVVVHADEIAGELTAHERRERAR